MIDEGSLEGKSFPFEASLNSIGLVECSERVIGRFRLRLRRLFGCNQVLCSYDLPFPVAFQPRVGPDESAALTAPPLPGLVTLSDGRAAVETNLNLVKVIRDEILWRFARLGNHLRLVIESALRINTDKIVGQDAFDRAGVPRRNRLRPLPFAIDDVLLFGAMVLLARASKCERGCKCDRNNVL